MKKLKYQAFFFTSKGTHNFAPFLYSSKKEAKREILSIARGNVSDGDYVLVSIYDESGKTLYQTNVHRNDGKFSYVKESNIF